MKTFELEVLDIGTSAPIITQHGDLWMLGVHKVFCGDVRNRMM